MLSDLLSARQRVRGVLVRGRQYASPGKPAALQGCVLEDGHGYLVSGICCGAQVSGRVTGVLA